MLNSSENSLPKTSSFLVRHRGKLLLAAVVLQVLFLVGVALSHYAVGWVGKEIRIQTAPVDPRNLLYGDYVRLNYDISQLNKSLWLGSGLLPKQGEPVYVLLKQLNSKPTGTYEAIGIYRQKPAIQADEAAVKGRVDYDYGTDLRIAYGLETYYVPENTGKELERQGGKMIAAIKVAPWGRSIIERLEAP
jgi:uncharacterized membrane-anchored protein